MVDVLQPVAWNMRLRVTGALLKVFPTWEYVWKGVPKVETQNEILVDIKDVSVDKNLSKDERIAEYVRQIKNPYCFKCGKFTVNVKFAENGPSLEDCLQRLVAV